MPDRRGRRKTPQETKTNVAGKTQKQSSHAKRTPVKTGSLKAYTWRGEGEEAQRPKETKAKRKSDIGRFRLKIAVNGENLAVTDQ